MNFILDRASLSKGSFPPAILSLNCTISPLGECILSLCEPIQHELIQQNISLSLRGFACDNQYLEGTPAIDEEAAFEDIETDLTENTNRIRVTNHFPTMELAGSFGDLATAFEALIKPKRQN